MTNHVETVTSWRGVSIVDLFAVVRAADALWRCQREYPDDPRMWEPFMEALHAALAACPGTGAALARWGQLQRNLAPAAPTGEDRTCPSE